MGISPQQFDQGHALVIGVNALQDAPPFISRSGEIVARDTLAIAQVLSNPDYCAYPPEQVAVVKDNNATKNGILIALDALAKRADRDDTVFIYYTGFSLEDPDHNYYLTTHDSKPYRHHGRDVIEPDTGISLTSLAEKIANLSANRVLIVINSNRSSEADVNTLLGTGPNRVVITACDQGQRSWFIFDDKHTIFGQATLDALRGEGVPNSTGYISILPLYQYIYEQVTTKVQKFRWKQDPELAVLQGISSFQIGLYRGGRETIGSDLFTDDSAEKEDRISVLWEPAFQALKAEVDQLRQQLQELQTKQFIQENPASVRMPEMTQRDKLYMLLRDDWFDDNDIRELCFFLHINFGVLSGDNKRLKAMALVNECVKNSRLDELQKTMYNLRPTLTELKPISPGSQIGLVDNL